MSKNWKTLFADHHDAIVSVVVVLVVLIVGVVIMDGFNGNTLNRACAAVDASRREVDASVELRFELASELSQVLYGLALEDSRLQTDMDAAVASYRGSEGVVTLVSKSYNQLDDVLKRLQRMLLLHPDLQESVGGQAVVRLLKSLGDCEENLVEAMASYEDAALYLERRINSFPMVFSAARRGITAPSRFSIQQALQTRP